MGSSRPVSTIQIMGNLRIEDYVSDRSTVTIRTADATVHFRLPILGFPWSRCGPRHPISSLVATPAAHFEKLRVVFQIGGKSLLATSQVFPYLAFLFLCKPEPL